MLGELEPQRYDSRQHLICRREKGAPDKAGCSETLWKSRMREGKWGGEDSCNKVGKYLTWVLTWDKKWALWTPASQAEEREAETEMLGSSDKKSLGPGSTWLLPANIQDCQPWYSSLWPLKPSWLERRRLFLTCPSPFPPRHTCGYLGAFSKHLGQDMPPSKTNGRQTLENCKRCGSEQPLSARTCFAFYQCFRKFYFRFKSFSTLEPWNEHRIQHIINSALQTAAHYAPVSF